MAFGLATVVAQGHGRPSFHHQQDKLLTPDMSPPGWFSTVTLSGPRQFCCRRPGWTPHWQATCDTTEFCRILSTRADLDNVFFQKPGLSFKQSIILPAYQFPQDCEAGNGGKPEPRRAQQQRFHLGLGSAAVRPSCVRSLRVH